METSFFLASPLGPLQVHMTPQGVSALNWRPTACGRSAETPAEQALAKALGAYFQGKRKVFQDFVFDLSAGTPFQQKVWRALITIPYGETRSYQWLAQTVGIPKGFQAVGQANGRNPLPILIPCHRIVNKNGCLGGYALGAEGGLQVKAFLLALEQQHAACPQTQGPRVLV